MPHLYELAGLTLLVAALYSSVGHGGASGYLAIMALASMPTTVTKPTALVLNLLVSAVGGFRYIREGCFRWKTFWPFIVGSIPFAFIGGRWVLSDAVYARILGLVLILAAAGLVVRRAEVTEEESIRDVPIPAGVLGGAGIGLVSGMIGVGGGIFLSPILILARWAGTRETLGIASAFIFVNSAAGLAGNLSRVQKLPPEAPWLALAAFLGGLLGSELGAKRLRSHWVRRVLAAVLLTASVKLLLGG